jgi:hypothetical protein
MATSIQYSIPAVKKLPLLQLKKVILANTLMLLLAAE